MEEENKINKIPNYYTDDTLREKEKRQKDWEMIAKDFPLFYHLN